MQGGSPHQETSWAPNYALASGYSSGEGSSDGRTFPSHRLLMGPSRSLANLDAEISLWLHISASIISYCDRNDSAFVHQRARIRKTSRLYPAERVFLSQIVIEVLENPPRFTVVAYLEELYAQLHSALSGGARFW